MRNRITISDLPEMSIGDVAALSPEELMLLLQDLDGAAKELALAETILRTGLDLRYGAQAAAMRRAEGKDTGTVRFGDGDCVVIADLPKKVDWDQDQLAAVVERIRTAGDDPTEYVDLAYRVPERKYGAWPAHIRTAFEAARTVRAGKPSFTLKPRTP